MGMSTHVIGFRPADTKWTAMKSVWDACKVAGVAPPDEVERFFGGEEPDPAGVEVDLGSALLSWDDRSRQGFEVDVTKLPPHVTRIRSYNSW